MQINARIDVCVCVCVCVCVHSGPVWMKCPGLIFCPSPALLASQLYEGYSPWTSIVFLFVSSGVSLYITPVCI